MINHQDSYRKANNLELAKGTMILMHLKVSSPVWFNYCADGLNPWLIGLLTTTQPRTNRDL